MTRKLRGRPLKHWRQGDGKPNSNKSNDPAQRQGELRIIGGTMRGRKFEYSGDFRTRPMMDTTREALFNLIGAWTTGKLVVDLFSGTGAIGFEAISRGAKRAILIERHIPTLELIKKNAASLEIEDRVETAQGDTFFWVKEFLQKVEAAKTDASSVEADFADVLSTPWLVFVCPPYDFFVDRKEQTVEMIEQLFRVAPSESVFAVESDIRFSAKNLPNADKWKVRQYSPAQIAVWRPEQE